jgi:hypothetical protein
MAMAFKHAGARGLAASRTTSGVRRVCSSGSGVRLRLKVAAIEPATSSEAEQPAASSLQPVDVEQLEIAELDAAQEQLLKWMLFVDGDQQERELEAEEGVEDPNDAEHAEIFDDVEEMLEEGIAASFKVGDKVLGTVYEVDDDGAYVEIGAKSAGFVPLVECALGRLKSVRGCRRCRGREGAAGRGIRRGGPVRAIAQIARAIPGDALLLARAAAAGPPARPATLPPRR